MRMGTEADTALENRRTILQGYVDQVTDALQANDAALAMEAHLSAYSAYISLTGQAASSYSSPLGQSVTRRAVEDAQKLVDSTWARFVEKLADSDVEITTVRSAIEYWELV